MNVLVEQIKAAFLELCSGLKTTDRILYTEVSEEKKSVAFSMYYRMIRVELVYSWKWVDTAPPSVLYCRVYPSKNEPWYLHLPILLGYLHSDDYRACVFPYIESVERMGVCFAALLAVVNDHMDEAEALADAGLDQKYTRDFLVNGYNSAAKRINTEKQDLEWDDDAILWGQSVTEWIHIARFSTLNAYAAFLSGNHGKALRLYRKMEKNGLCEYEQGLCRFMENPANRSFRPMSSGCYALRDCKKNTGFFADIKGMLFLFGAFSLVFCLLILLLHSIHAQGTRYFFGMEWWFGFILAGLPAVLGYASFQSRIQEILNRKRPGAADFYKVAQEPSRIYKIAKWIVIAVLIAELGLCVWLSGENTRFYDTYGVSYNMREEYVRFDYKDVEEIFRIDARYNVYGDRIERPSYVLLLSDGSMIDLDGNGSIEKQYEIVSALFDRIRITELDSDRDLP